MFELVWKYVPLFLKQTEFCVHFVLLVRLLTKVLWIYVLELTDYHLTLVPSSCTIKLKFSFSRNIFCTILWEPTATPLTGSYRHSIAEPIRFGMALLNLRGSVQGSMYVKVTWWLYKHHKSQKSELPRGIASGQSPTGLPAYFWLTFSFPFSSTMVTTLFKPRTGQVYLFRMPLSSIHSMQSLSIMVLRASWYQR